MLKAKRITKNYFPPLFSYISPIKTPIVLAIDAICVVTTNKYLPKTQENLYAFTLYIQPISHGKKCIPTRLIEHKSGIGNKDICKMLIQTSSELENSFFSVKFLSFDGDKCYDTIHRNFFNNYKKFLLKGDLFGAIKFLKDKTNLPIGDYMHILKNLRSHFLRNEISLDANGKVTFSIDDLIKAFGDQEPFIKDTSLIGKMRDQYALQFFDMNNVRTLLNNDDLILVFALLPLSLIHLSMRSPDMPIRSRIFSLCLSFYLVYYQLITVERRKKTIISQRKSKKRFCSFFSKISLIRLLNSILSILIAFYLRYDSLCLDRLGTHCLEFFFGLLRGFSDGVDGWERFYRTVCKTILAQRFLCELNIETTIKHRANLAGVEINEYLDDDEFEKVTKEAHETAKELFKCLNTFNKCIEAEKFTNNVFFKNILFNYNFSNI